MTKKESIDDNSLDILFEDYHENDWDESWSHSAAGASEELGSKNEEKMFQHLWDEYQRTGIPPVELYEDIDDLIKDVLGYYPSSGEDEEEKEDAIRAIEKASELYKFDIVKKESATPDRWKELAGIVCEGDKNDSYEELERWFGHYAYGGQLPDDLPSIVKEFFMRNKFDIPKMRKELDKMKAWRTILATEQKVHDSPAEREPSREDEEEAMVQASLENEKKDQETTKITKEQIKEMVRKVVRKALDEQFDRGDFEWHQSMKEDDLFKVLKQTKMPPIARQKMDQVIASLENNPGMRRYLTRPQNTQKIETALAKGKFDALTTALENLVIKAAKASRTN